MKPFILKTVALQTAAPEIFDQKTSAPKTHGWKSSSGFTLLEVLVALVFFALIGMTLQQVTASTVNQYQSVRHKMFSSWLAENKMTEMQLAKSLPPAKEYKEDLEFANEEWQLVSKVQTTENPDIQKVDVEVFHIDANTSEKSKKLTLTGFLGRY